MGIDEIVSVADVVPTRVGQLPSVGRTIDASTILEVAIAMLEAAANLPGLVVIDTPQEPGTRRVTLLSRRRLAEVLRRQYTQELYLHRPVGELLSRVVQSVMMVGGQESIEQVFKKAVTRGNDDLSEPLLVRHEDDSITMLDVADLMRAQCDLLEHRNRELAAATTRAEAANRAKSDFLAHMSHEIRTPMTAILDNAELLQDDGDISKAPERRVEAVTTIQRAGHHLLDLINDILDVSKVEAGKLELEATPCDFAEIISDVCCTMKQPCEKKHLSLITQLDPSLSSAWILSDARRLKQILINLVGNAVKFTETGSITIRTQAVTPLTQDASGFLTIQIDVIDTGEGMSIDQIERLFKPFSQGDASMSRRHGGTGLGLVISRSLARLMGGDLTVSSTEGQGSIFTLTICQARAAAQDSGRPAPSTSPRPAGGPPLAGMRVLLAEDGIDNQRLFVFHLERAGAKVDLVVNGLQAVAFALKSEACRTPYDIVLMDMQMPELDGYEATQRLRMVRYEQPIIALTAHALTNELIRCREAGCDDVASKPISKAKLIELCQAWYWRGHHASSGDNPLADAA